MTRRVIVVLLVLASLSLVPLSPAHAVDPNHVRIAPLAYGVRLGASTALAFPNDSTGRIFAVLQSGIIKVRVSGRGWLPFLDIRSRVRSGGEQGLLGMALHPGYRTNGMFYLSYTDSTGALRVSRFHATPSANAAGTGEYNLLRVAHPGQTNHNGGQLAFGTDGYLYVGTGDGGGSGDPPGNAQNVNALLGKVLRFDISHGCGSLRYCIPRTNPFYGMSGRRAEIWEYGIRNPWRFSFDRGTGTLWIADVGQGSQEEITPVGVGGRNLGWDCREGNLNTASQYGGSYCSGRTFMPPLYVYGHSSGRCAIIGGYVYRGRTYASIMGAMYIYADFCTGEIWGLAKQTDGRWLNARIYDHTSQITTFGETPSGEVFMGDASGNVYLLRGVRR